jgi:hypothetical protein
VDVGNLVDGNDFDVFAAIDGTKDISTDATKSHQANANGHQVTPVWTGLLRSEEQRRCCGQFPVAVLPIPRQNNASQ